MRVSLVTLRRRGSGPAARRAESVECDVLRIGRGSDNSLSLPGLSISLRHAEIHRDGTAFYLEPVGTNELRINGRRARVRKSLAVGDTLRIGPHELRIVPAEGDEDLRIEIETSTEASPGVAELLGRTQVATGPRWFSRRTASWLLVLGVLVAFLVMPLTTGFLESSWSSGELSRAHAFIADDCGRCHEGHFQRVQDEVCLSCHPRVGHHAPEDAQPVGLAEIRCASCHVEHNGLAGLASLEERSCSSCHAELAQRIEGLELADASDFGRDHPQFSLALVSDASEEPSEIEWAPGLEERSGLVFNHLRHVGQVVRDLATGEKRYMPCGDCHTLDRAGQLMQPIAFERHCQSCHALHYDEAQSERQAPHGDPVEMRRQLREFYLGLAMTGDVVDEAAPVFLRRRAPGRELSEPQRRAAIEWANGQVDSADRYLMEEPGHCRNCHRVNEGSAADGGYGVAPVQIAEVWMPQGRFHHESHESFPCADCHAAAAVFAPKEDARLPRPDWSLREAGNLYALRTSTELEQEAGAEPSKVAGDVLIPGIEPCRSCHGGARAKPPRIASDCVLCHPFHRDEHGPLRAAAGPTALARKLTARSEPRPPGAGSFHGSLDP